MKVLKCVLFSLLFTAFWTWVFTGDSSMLGRVVFFGTTFITGVLVYYTLFYYLD